ncbi:glycoside hydrolase family 25 protein [Massiliimalia massiliensis]|jgi:lysozyme|uniref:glycoside hydrolase family 25 protein n=1 Tax=Massiliimalia massiliensis TaxID=1852384 RepID=UPI00196860BE|nr:GH25 family lysozyme [Massiliimalia massiliensis]
MMKKRAVCTSLVFLACLIFLIPAMLYFGVIQPNRMTAKQFPIHGVDVSSYQGEIDWGVLAEEGISFAYIKATEGSGFTDQRFAENWKQASETGLKIGAYHFFSYDSSGKTQAENFIRTVPKLPGMLPPVIDVEFYGDKEQNPPEREDVDKLLKELVGELEAYYGMKPVLYATEKSYRMYLKGDYQECPIWIRDIWKRPVLHDREHWTFWQYSSRERLRGYQGKEEYIDKNVFYGTAEEWEQEFC